MIPTANFSQIKDIKGLLGIKLITIKSRLDFTFIMIENRSRNLLTIVMLPRFRL